MKKLILFPLLLFCAFRLWGQEIDIKQVYVKEGKVHLIYDLHDQDDNRSYQVRLYSSQDNFISPLNKVKGDVGMEVSPGKNKEVIWNAREEFDENQNSPLSFELRGRVYVPFVRLNDFNEYKIMKRSKEYEVTWTGGRSTNILTIDLYKGDQKVASFPNIANAGHYTLELPKDIKPGKNYRMKISDKNNKDEIVFSDFFTVKRKIPLVFQIVPGLVGGFVAYYIVTNLGKDNNNTMVGPPSPPQE